jgi:hypothetical protein
MTSTTPIALARAAVQATKAATDVYSPTPAERAR